jgi:hypothetical protein
VRRVVLEPFFLHAEQVLALLGSERADAPRRDRERRLTLPATTSHLLAEHLAASIAEFNIVELQRSVYEQTIAVGDVVGVQQAFYFKRAKERDREDDAPIDFRGRLNTDSSITVVGTLNSKRCVAASSLGNLSGRRSVYIIGAVTELALNSVRLRPMFAGNRMIVEDQGFEDVIFAERLLAESRRVYPSEIDQFKKANLITELHEEDLAALLKMSEEQVKNSLAEIIGEPFVHKDWGGERSDLYTSRLSVSGVQTSSAWLLKGPGFPRPMTVAALGKPGDQVDRLYSEPAELLVLQHCHEIRTAVVNMMETYAFDMRRPRRYMILDGWETAAILRAHGKLVSRSLDEENKNT